MQKIISESGISDIKIGQKSGNPPVISIHDLDITYYGKNLQDYLYIEFDNKTQDEIEFENITPIPFWLDIM